jgi:predicted methyltransferase
MQIVFTRRGRTFITALAIAVACRAAAGQSAADNAAHAAWLTQVLGVKDGSAVGEIGAGEGELTILLAKTVGPAGRILSNELNVDRVKSITKAAVSTGLSNVTAVQGAPAETNFPDQCCDAIFMRDVYHHFDDPPAMNASILKSLKPGGRLAIIDFTPPPGPGGENPPGHRGEDNHHGITAATLERELKAAGFELVSSATEDRGVKVVARRPA